MTAHDPAVVKAILRRSFAGFVVKSFQYLSPSQQLELSWHVYALCWHLEQVRLGRIRRLIINLPPRHLKSIIASVAFPAFVLGHDPSKRIICASYGNDLSDKLAVDCRHIINADWYRQIFPNTLISREKGAVSDFNLTAGGNRLATSVGGVLTGRGGGLVIIDDPMKADDVMSAAKRKSATDWFDNTLYTRLDDKRTDAIVIVMQRLHQEDLVGHVLSKGEDWTVLSLPAIAEIDETIRIGDDQYHSRKVGDLLQPVREPMEVLNQTKTSIGGFAFSAQYQQAPIPVDGEIFKWSWFQTYEQEPAREGQDRIVQSWDTASKSGEINDFSVCTTWLVKGRDYYLLDILRKRLKFPELRQAVVDQFARWRPSSILIEDKASGTALIQELQRNVSPGMVKPIAIQPEGDKIMRACAQSAAIEAGHVFLPKAAPWLSDFHSEIVQFPSGRHDDQIDSMTQFLCWIRRPSMQVVKVKIGGI